jgi:hypothetical protein
MLLILRRTALLNYLTPTIAATKLADTMRAHQLIARRARNQCRRIKALVLTAIATAVARDFCFWCGTHCCIPNPFLAIVVVEQVGELRPPPKPNFVS